MIGLISAGAKSTSPSSSRRRFFLLESSSSASAENEGAARHSVKIGLIEAASSASTSRLVAMTSNT